eukprot:1077139-Amphidinium_carterae.1
MTIGPLLARSVAMSTSSMLAKESICNSRRPRARVLRDVHRSSCTLWSHAYGPVQKNHSLGSHTHSLKHHEQKAHQA